MTTPNGKRVNEDAAGNAKSGEKMRQRPKLSPQERTERNLRLLQQHGSQLIVPRSTEVWILIRMVYPLNTAVSKLRSQVGMSMTIDVVMGALEPIQRWLDESGRWLRDTGGDLILSASALSDSPQERQQLAHRSNAHVIVPKSEEVRLVLEQIRRMDQVLVVLRTLSLSDLKNDGRLARGIELVQTFNEVVGKVCESARVDYRPPRELAKGKATEPVTMNGKASDVVVTH